MGTGRENHLGRLLPCQGWREWEFCRDDGNHLGRLLPSQGWRKREFCRDDGNHLGNLLPCRVGILS